jgi:hypothetical protein
MNNVLDIVVAITKVALTIIGLLKILNGEIVEGLLFVSYAKLMDIEDTIRKSIKKEDPK